MRILILYAHPVETSFVAACHARVADVLRARGHDVDDCDLNAEGFDPVLSRQDRITYHEPTANRARVAPYVERLLAAEAIVFVHPVWNFGFPAILKGFVDRVLLPGVSFEIDGRGNLTFPLDIKRVGAVCTYGGERWRAFLAGDPPRKIMGRMIRPHLAPRGRLDYLACYDMNHTTPERRAAFLAKIELVFRTW